MQKYDDFGRPIYETAEEYNRAHGTGGSVFSRESFDAEANKHSVKATSAPKETAAQRHANRANSKKAKTIVIGVVAFFIALNAVIIFSMSNLVGSVGAQPEPVYPDTWEDDYSEYLGDTETPLPVGYENFIYNGVAYTLPMKYDVISQMGFVLEEDYELDDLIPTEFNEMLSLYADDGDTFAMVIVKNNTGESIPLAQCTVEYFYIENPAAFDEIGITPDFSFGAGINFESTYEEVETYLGVPYYHYADHSEEGCYYDAYEWSYYGDDEYHHVNIVFWNGLISDISIQKEYYSMQL